MPLVLRRITGKIWAIALNCDRDRQPCIQNCLDYHSICLNPVTHCLQQNGQQAEAAHIALIRTSLNFQALASKSIVQEEIF